MRMIFLIMCLLAFQLNANPIRLQEANISLDMDNSSVDQVLQMIEKKTNYSFVYNNKLINADRKVDIHVKNVGLSNILDQLFKSTNVAYEIRGTQIVLTTTKVQALAGKSPQKKKEVTGTVVDARGEPIIGATILEKGIGGNGTSTDIDGRFMLWVEPNSILQITSIGYITQEVGVSGKNTLSIVLRDNSKALDEVVVTALGIKREKKALSYNVQEIKQDEITRVKSANFVNSLSGKVAGVTINSSSGGIGGASKVVMRGAKSIEKSNNALYVIDGVPMLSLTSTQGEDRYQSAGSTEGIADINPEDIESMTVLTGATAAALYGSAAANGAIVITTKRGQEGKVKVSVSSNLEFGKPFVMPEFQNTYGNDGRITSWGAKLPEGTERYKPTDFFNTAHNYTNSFTLSGGSAKNLSFLSASTTNSAGLIPNNTYNRYNFTYNNTSYFLNDRLKLDVSTSYVIQNNRNMVNQGEYMNPLVGAYLLPRGDGLEKTKVFERYNVTRKIYEQVWGDFAEQPSGLFSGSYSGDYTLQNPYWVAYRNVRDVSRKRFMASAGANYLIKKWSESERWDIGGRIRIDNTRYKTSDKRYASTLATLDVSTNGYFGYAEGTENQLYMDAISSFTKSLNWDKVGFFQLNINLGASLQDARKDGSFARGSLIEKGIANFFNVFQIDQTNLKSSYGQEGWLEQTQSVFASAEVGYNSYLYLTLTGRNDWASQLRNSPNHSFFYPSVGLSGIVTEMLSNETRDRISSVLSFLKLKASYSSVASPFPRELTSPTYKFNQNDKVWSSQMNYPIGNLYPERTNSFETGFSTKWLRNKLGFDFTYYRTNTYNQTLKTEVASGGGWDAFYIQAGNVRNWGLEGGIDFTVKAINNFSWNTHLTASLNENKITKLQDYINPTTGLTESSDMLVRSSMGGLRYMLKTGGSIGDVYSMSDFKRNMDGEIFVDDNGGLSIEDYQSKKDYVKLGSVLPKYNLGWRNDFSYRNFSFGGLFAGRIGGIVVSMTEAAMDNYGVSKASADARDAGGVLINGNLVAAQNYFSVRGKNMLPQYYTYSATNFRLQEAYIGYTIPRKTLGNIFDCTVSVVGRNLWMIYNKAPYDPEVVSSTGNYTQGLDYFMLPSLRSFAFNLKFNF